MFTDFFQRTITDVGAIGPDRARGGLYLLLPVAAHHGSPWKYDTHVPVIFAGNKLKAKQISRRINTVDIAPTLASFIGTKAPSGSDGEILAEVVKN